MVLPDAQQQLIASNPTGEQLARANRVFLEKHLFLRLMAGSPH